MPNDLANPPQAFPYTTIARARTELEALRTRAAEAVVEAEQLEAQCVTLGLDPDSAAWLIARFQRFLISLQAESDALVPAAGSPTTQPVPPVALPWALGPTPSDATSTQPVAPAGPATPPVPATPAALAPAPTPTSQPVPPLPEACATPSPADPVVIEAPAPSPEAPPEFERAFWREDEAPPWSARVTKRMRFSKANAYALGALIAAVLAVVVYLS